MNDGGLIREVYAKTEAFFIREIDNAQRMGDPVDGDRLALESRVNQYAYFVLFWGQFEVLVKELAYEHEAEESKDLGLMPKLKLCLARKLIDFNEIGNHYDSIDEIYAWRCDLAHGRLRQFPDWSLTDVFDKIEKVAEVIEKGTEASNKYYEDLFGIGGEDSN